jgi:hypothetical protein
MCNRRNLKISREEPTVTIQKKSLISSLNATKKAIVVSSATPASPTLNAPVSARLATRVNTRVNTRIATRVNTRVAAKIGTRVVAKIKTRVKN